MCLSIQIGKVVVVHIEKTNRYIRVLLIIVHVAYTQPSDISVTNVYFSKQTYGAWS